MTIRKYSGWRVLASLSVIMMLTTGLLAYGTIGDVQLETARLQRVAPEAALRIERSATFGKTARDLQLAQRVKEFVDELPSRLAGGDTGTVIRSAATRTLAYLATGVLMLFLLAHGPRLCEAALRQISDLGTQGVDVFDVHVVVLQGVLNIGPHFLTAQGPTWLSLGSEPDVGPIQRVGHDAACGPLPQWFPCGNLAPTSSVPEIRRENTCR